MKTCITDWSPPFYVLQERPGLRFREPRIIAQALAHHTGPRRVVLQAGGHLGIWAAKLGTLFVQVVSFEPIWRNWQVCLESIQTDNVLMLYGCLGATGGARRITDIAKAFSGSAHVTAKSPYVSVPCYTIDGLPAWLRAQIDALFLDVEGYELAVLRGAEQTLRAMHPLVVVEENACGLMHDVQPGDVGRWLAALGYQAVGRYDRDVVYVMEGKKA